ncbi:hypothetical protein [Maribacter sp. 2307UL18-2]|uniref:hypothetical protein n=1 Tax=Maribacter sp. 2307UL18-2 TaxID=3386274 RepID=UPI0039BCC378
MAITTVLLGSFLLYGTSKYFPEKFLKIRYLVAKNRKMAKLLGCSLLLLSVMLFSLKNGFATGFIMFAITLFLALSSLVISLSVHKKLIYLFIVIVVGDLLTLILF